MISDLKPYAEYKESGLPWLEEVPGHWEIKRGKSYLTAIDERSKTGKEELLTVSSARGVVPRRTANVTMFKAESYTGHKLCWPDDLVINSLWAWAGGLGVSTYHGIISTAYSVYRARKSAGINPRFLHELVRSSAYQWELQVRSKGVWISRLQLTDTAFLDSPIPLPPPAEQAAIVRFLDWANGRLERAIRAKQKVIALWNEQKQAIIHRAVTRGLDPSVPLKPSGIPWLGDIPAHWETRKLRTLFRLQGSGTTPSGERYYGGSTNWVMSGDLNDAVVTTTKRTVQAVALESYSTLKLYPPGSLVVAMYGATIGKTGILGKHACTNQACCVLAHPIDDARAKFLQLVVQAAKPHLVSEGYGGGQPNINAEVVRALRIGLPPAKEQERILESINSSTHQLVTAVSRLEREIDFLREYRTRLVVDLVTGKLDVREAATLLPDDELLPDLAAADDEHDDLPIEEEADA